MWSSRLGTDGYELEYLLSAGNLIRNGSMALPPGPDDLPGVADRIPGMFQLPRHNLLQVLLTVPFYLAGMPFNRLFTPLESGLMALPMGSLLAVSLLNPLLTLAAAVLILEIGIALGYPAPASRRAAIVYGFATMAWPYAAIGMEPLQTAAMLLAFLLYVRMLQNGSTGNGVLLALAITALMHTKISAPVLALPVAIAGIVHLLKNRRIRALCLYSAILSLSAVLWFVLYEIRRNEFYGDHFFNNFVIRLVPRNILGMLISPGKSLFVYNPILLWCLPGIIAFFKRQRSLAMVMTITGVLCLVLTACWDWSLIEECWGPRYLMPFVPMLMIMGLDRLDPEPVRRRRLVFVLLLGLSVIVQIPGVLYPNVCLLGAVHNEDVPIVDLTTWAPDLSPVWVGWRMIGQKFDESFGYPPEPLRWHHYRGIVGHGTRPTVAEFDTRDVNRPYTAPFLLARYLQRPIDGTGADSQDPGWIFPLWLAVMLVSGSMLIVLALSPGLCVSAWGRETREEIVERRGRARS